MEPMPAFYANTSRFHSLFAHAHTGAVGRQVAGGFGAFGPSRLPQQSRGGPYEMEGANQAGIGVRHF